MSALDITDLSKSYGVTEVLNHLQLSVSEGGLTAVLGSSGSGKSTLLRVIAGFENADEGAVMIDGQIVDDGRRTVRPQHRGVGYVPQDAGLFPHLTVAANIGFGVPRRQRLQLRELVALVGLSGYEKRYPHQLSGGQQQRVALARALAIKPRILLLDEPFGSLDAALRESVRGDVMRILSETGTTTVLVTHDQDEALSLADQVAILENGRIVARGTPRELYGRPPSIDVATTIGTANILAGERRGNRIHWALGDFADPRVAVSPGATACSLVLRPEHLSVSTTPRPGSLPATVTAIRYHGHDVVIQALGGDPAGTTLTARIAGDAELAVGQAVWLCAAQSPTLVA